MKIAERAYAKVNITLDVLAKRPDGYHELETVMQTLALHDTLTLHFHNGGRIAAESNPPGLPRDHRNITVAAALAFYKETGLSCGGLTVHTEKRIPAGAGLGGGSADAAAVLRALNRFHGGLLDRQALLLLAAQIGSDLPFCLEGGTQLARGRGEILSPLPPMPPCCVVLCKPPGSVSTADVFARLRMEEIGIRPDTPAVVDALERKDLLDVAAQMANVLTGCGQPPDLPQIADTMRGHGALGAVMSGSGATVFGLFREQAAAAEAATILRTSYREVFQTKIWP